VIERKREDVRVINEKEAKKNPIEMVSLTFHYQSVKRKERIKSYA
jgi:hypothetical protein